MLDWHRVLADLIDGVVHRLHNGIQTTEDTVRYYFFLQLVRPGITPEKMVLERPHPHPALESKGIDLSVVHLHGVWDFEVEYRRPIPSGRNRPRTQLRGQVIADLYKLALSDAQRSYLLYLAGLWSYAIWPP